MKTGGAMESRTPDLLHAMQALYQLSYDPEDGKLSKDGRACKGEKPRPALGTTFPPCESNTF